jgi:hypothetical protein
MLLLKEGSMGKAREPSNSKAVSEIREHWIEKYISLFVFVCVSQR